MGLLDKIFGKDKDELNPEDNKKLSKHLGSSVGNSIPVDGPIEELPETEPVEEMPQEGSSAKAAGYRRIMPSLKGTEIYDQELARANKELAETGEASPEQVNKLIKEQDNIIAKYDKDSALEYLPEYMQEHITQYKDLKEKAQAKAKEQKGDLQTLQLIEGIGNALLMMMGGAYGIKHNVDTSGTKFNKQDWIKHYRDVREDLADKVEQLDDSRYKAQSLGDRNKQQSLSRQEQSAKDKVRRAEREQQEIKSRREQLEKLAFALKEGKLSIDNANEMKRYRAEIDNERNRIRQEEERLRLESKQKAEESKAPSIDVKQAKKGKDAILKAMASLNSGEKPEKALAKLTIPGSGRIVKQSTVEGWFSDGIDEDRLKELLQDELGRYTYMIKNPTDPKALELEE